MLLMFNADHANTIPFTLPPVEDSQSWELLADSGRNDEKVPRQVEKSYELLPCSAAVLRSKTSEKSK